MISASEGAGKSDVPAADCGAKRERLWVSPACQSDGLLDWDEIAS